MRVESIEIDRQMGVIIKTVSVDDISIGTTLSILYDEKEHYFEIININTDGIGTISVKAKEIAYWCNRFDHIKVDIRNLLYKDIQKVTDDEKLKQIAKENCWC